MWVWVWVLCKRNARCEMELKCSCITTSYLSCKARFHFSKKILSNVNSCHAFLISTVIRSECDDFFPPSLYFYFYLFFLECQLGICSTFMRACELLCFSISINCDMEHQELISMPILQHQEHEQHWNAIAPRRIKKIKMRKPLSDRKYLQLVWLFLFSSTLLKFLAIYK
jgi:hypothetical protein